VRRRYVGPLGAVLLALPVVVVLAFGADALRSPSNAVQYGSLTLAGLLLVAAGARERYEIGGRTVPWNLLYGVGTLVLGVGIAVGNALSPPAGEVAPLFVFAAVVGGLALAYVGYDIARGGRYVAVERAD
jgi:hypothetical protein